MRKISILLIAASILLTSCVKMGPMGPMGPQGPQGPAGPSCTYKIINFDVPVKAWQPVKEEGDIICYSAGVDMPEITENVFDGSIINVYRTFNFDKLDAWQQVLPYQRFYREELEEGGIAYYTESIDYEYGIGWLKIYYTVSDFYYPVIPEAMTFRCIIVY